MYKFKINSIKFNEGSEFVLGALTIIVGPIIANTILDRVLHHAT
ncbi:hypothetical protein [Clostridium neonatale]|nr:hypothetical protein [Clostridium neonatale]CAI3721514.1 hypothetical protein CNEO4_830025 [Clostridium neonatale]CAI3724774.1 hypothetical protein CNEO4_860020 [Clostridium neonatale]